MKAFLVLMALGLTVVLCAAADARVYQDCSGRGHSIQAVLASTIACSPRRGATLEAMLLRPHSAHYNSPYVLSTYYNTDALILGSSYAPWVGYMYYMGGRTNPSVYYHSHPPVMYTPYWWGR